MKKLLTFLCVSLFVFCVNASESGTLAFVEGCKFFSQGDWNSAKIMLRKAASYPENVTPETYYMLISAESYSGDDKAALDDCNLYLEKFKNSLYTSQISYQKGKCLYNLGEYEKAIVTLSDFCHQNEKSDLYSYALFYIGESLFASYKYDDAERIYERIITEFPESQKAPAAQYRMETILQRGREEKLLYLLKQTGEEYLSAKEEYERQLRMYNSEGLDSTRQRLLEAQAKNEALEKRVSDLEQQLYMENQKKENNSGADNAVKPKTSDASIENEVDVPNSEPYDETKEQIRLLKIKAQEAQEILNQK